MNEDSFVSAMKGTLGVITVVVIIFVIAPCVFCGGMAILGNAMEEAEQHEEY